MNFDKYLSKIQRIASKKGFVTEDDIMETIDRYDIPIIHIQEYITAIQKSGIIIKECSVSESKKTKNIVKERVSTYIVERQKLIDAEPDVVKSSFINDYKKAKCQSSYMPVTVLGIIDRADVNGQCNISELSKYLIDFYELRKLHGLITEQPKSIFSNLVLDELQVKKLILFNPLGRSILIKYIWYDEKIDSAIVNPALWNTLTAPELSLIREISKEHLQKYYSRIDNKTDNN